MTRHFHRKWWQYNVKGVCCKRHGRSRLSLIYGRPREIRRCMGNLASRHTFKSPSPCLAAPNKTLKHSETVNDLMIQYLARHLCQQLGRLIRPTTTTLIPGCSRMLQDAPGCFILLIYSLDKSTKAKPKGGKGRARRANKWRRRSSGGRRDDWSIGLRGANAESCRIEWDKWAIESDVRSSEPHLSARIETEENIKQIEEEEEEEEEEVRTACFVVQQ